MMQASQINQVIHKFHNQKEFQNLPGIKLQEQKYNSYSGMFAQPKSICWKVRMAVFSFWIK